METDDDATASEHEEEQPFTSLEPSSSSSVSRALPVLLQPPRQSTSIKLNAIAQTLPTEYLPGQYPRVKYQSTNPSANPPAHDHFPPSSYQPRRLDPAYPSVHADYTQSQGLILPHDLQDLSADDRFISNAITSPPVPPRGPAYGPMSSSSLFFLSSVPWAYPAAAPLIPPPTTGLNPYDGAKPSPTASRSVMKATNTTLNLAPPSSWLQGNSGRQWLQTHNGLDWLETQSGQVWLQMPIGQSWQLTPEGCAWVSRRSLKLHWQLLPYDPTRTKRLIHFDIIFPICDIEYRQNSSRGVQHTPISDTDLDKPAADKELTGMIINFQHDPFEWDIDVKRSEGIRVRDVFEAVYAAFQLPLTSHEMSLIPRHRHAGYEQAFRLRCNLVAEPIVEDSQVWKRVDTLLHETLFHGLTRSTLGDWWLSVTGMMPAGKRGVNIKGKDLLSEAPIHDSNITASNSPSILSDSVGEGEYLSPSHNSPPKYPDINLFNLPLSAAFASSTNVHSDPMLLSWSACRICNFLHLNAFLQHGTLYALMDNIPPFIPDPASQDFTWAFFCRFVPLSGLFDSPARGPPPITQLGNGRARLIERLELELEIPRNSMSWLHGSPGTGKSVIAYTLASRCRQKHRLMGSFFFSRRHASCGSAHSAVLALAYQLGLSDPLAKGKILTALNNDPGIVFPSRDLREQFARLLIEPLEAVDWHLPSRVFIIDAVDQCQDQGPDLISLLTRLLSHLTNASLHTFFTSRDEVFIKPHLATVTSVSIEGQFAVVASHFADVGLRRIDIDSDIRSFLRQSFEKIHTRHRLQCRKPWPPNEVLRNIVDRVGPYFDTASVVVKFVESLDHDPTDRMDLIYDALTDPSLPLGLSVDAFYKAIISTSDDIEQAYLHLTIVGSLADMLSCSQLDNLLNRGTPQEFDMHSVLSQFPPLVRIPAGYDSSVQVCHESLFDFLCDPLRCGEHFNSQAMVHRLLAYSSLSVMVEELPDDRTLSSHLSQLMTDRTSLSGFDDQSVLSHAVNSPPDPLQLLSTFWHIIQNRVTDRTPDPRTTSALRYFCRTWQILQHLDLSSFDTLPAFRFLEDLRSLPVLLAFPIFLSFESPANGQTPGPSTLQHEPHIQALDAVTEVVKYVYALKEGRRTGSGALDYACTHWAYHLSLAEWDNDLRSILIDFMKQKLHHWLMKAWCLQDLETCLRTLSEVQTLCLTADLPVRFGFDAQHTDADMDAQQKAEEDEAEKQRAQAEMSEDAAQHIIPTTPIRVFEDGGESVLAVAVFLDGQRMVTSGKTLRLWNLKDGAVLKIMEGHEDLVWGVGISRDGGLIASGDEKGELIFWNDGGEFTQAIKAHTTWISSVDFSPDGGVLATSSTDWTTKLWNTETGRREGDTIDCGAPVHCVRYSPSGGLIALAAGKCIQIWNTGTREWIANLNAATSPNLSLAWTHDGTRLLSAGSYYDPTIREWDSSTWEQVGDPWDGHASDIRDIVVNPAGTLVASASRDKSVRLWRLSDRRTIASFKLKYSDEVFSVTFSIDGKHIFGGGYDKKVSEWAVPEDALQGNAAEDSDSKILAINMTVRNACISGEFLPAEELLTQEIDANPDNYSSYINRAIIMVRKSDWDQALWDATKSLSIQPSLIGYIAKGIALCGQKQVEDAMKAFDFALMFANKDSKTTLLLLLIKAIALFNANQREDAMSRVQELVDTYPNADVHACRIVKAYLCLELGINVWKSQRHEEAIQYFTAAVEASAFSSKWAIHVIYEDFVVLFGWDLKTMWQAANKHRCDALLFTGRPGEALKSYQYMMDMSDETVKASCLYWSTVFKQEWSSIYAGDGDKALSSRDYDRALHLYSAVIDLDSATDIIFANRCRVRLAKKEWEEGLLDAQKVIQLNPSFYFGYELKHAALHGAGRYDEAIEAFKTLLSKLDQAPDAQIRKLRQKYLDSSEAEVTILRVINAQLENAPLRLLNTRTGRLCDRTAQIHKFTTNSKYKKLLSFTMKHADLQDRITTAVGKYFRHVMLSHRWEGQLKEPQLQDIQDKTVYGLQNPLQISGIIKLQSFCKIAHGAGFRWAWIDTCCIDRNNSIELQKSLNSMFVWYRHSALTIIYLSDVPPSSQPGALARSAWNTRGWTVPEFLAPKVILFYQNDWTPYLGDISRNHKQSTAIMQELEEATGVNAGAIVAFTPGMTDVREKLRWASTRVTMLQEDIAYSLFGIFGVNLPIMYGEGKQKALGRLLEEIVAQSGDISALDWVGKSSEFNSCLPADITAYEKPPSVRPSLSEEEIQTAVSSLRDAGVVALAVRFYSILTYHSAPRFAQCRLQLPCISFTVTEIRRRRDHETHPTYEVKADGLKDLIITTEDRLPLFAPARPIKQTYLLVRPWNHHLLDEPDFADDQTVEDSSLHESVISNAPRGPPGGTELPVYLKSQSRALRFIVRLGQPFGAFLLAQRGAEFKRIAADHDIIAEVRDKTSVRDMMGTRTLEIL